MLIAGLVLASSAGAQVLPRHGACPEAYAASGSFCAPLHPGSPPAIERGSGSCPEGFHSSGNGYCVGYGGAKSAVTRPAGAACPASMHASGGACVSFR